MALTSNGDVLRGRFTSRRATSTDTRTDAEIQAHVFAELKIRAPRPDQRDRRRRERRRCHAHGYVDSCLKKWSPKAAHRLRVVKAVASEIEVRLLSSSERTEEDTGAASS